ncbi:MAG: pyridoxamine 5'-phosphate oxidase family protein [Aliidongia sp.]
MPDERVRALIQRADTLFVASYVERENDRRQVDVSHRGGRPGFVRLGSDASSPFRTSPASVLQYARNFLVNPKGGLAFRTGETGDLLQLTGDGRGHP